MNMRSAHRGMVVRVSLVAAVLIAGVAGPAPAADAKIVGQKVAGNLRQAVAFTFDARDRLWVVEKQVGSIYVQRLGSRHRRRFFKIPNVHGTGGQGLLGIALHPKFPAAPWIYAFATRDVGGNVVDQLVRIRSVNGKGRRMQILHSSDAGSLNMHSGGRIMFGPDKMLYVYIGDAHRATTAQRLRSPRGKILRMTPWGGVPDDNPIRGSRVFGYGSGTRSGWRSIPAPSASGRRTTGQSATTS